jgi:hypothetical protein
LARSAYGAFFAGTTMGPGATQIWKSRAPYVLTFWHFFYLYDQYTFQGVFSKKFKLSFGLLLILADQ